LSGKELAMKKSRFSEEQIAFALRQAESGTALEEICRKLGVTQATFYRWKRKFAGMGVCEVRKLKQLVADLSLDRAMLREVLSKKL
jgi:putative transposase